MPEILRIFNATNGTSLDWIAVFTFLAVAFIYFLVPVLGYLATSRGLILISLYLLIAYALLTLFEGAIQYFLYLAFSNPETISRTSLNLGFLFALLHLTLYIAAQIALVLGLRNLQRS